MSKVVELLDTVDITNTIEEADNVPLNDSNEIELRINSPNSLNQIASNSSHFAITSTMERRILQQHKKIRNILIVGRTNGGKSTLANVLCNTVEFEESELTIRKTRDLQDKFFKWEETKYHVIDIRVSPTEREALYNKIGEIIKLMPEGVSQVLFVIDERFTAEDIDVFKPFRDAIFHSDIVKYTTIVRTKFGNFKNEGECKKDKNDLRKGLIMIDPQLHNNKNNKKSKSIANIIKSCRDIVYVDNPPINIKPIDEDDHARIGTNKKTREKSRLILLNYLERVCPNENYKLPIWDKLPKNSEILANEVERHLISDVPSLGKIKKIKNKNLHCSIS